MIPLDPMRVDVVSKGVGDWKTIDQREQTQRRDRKVMRRAGAGATVGAGLVAVGLKHPGAVKSMKSAGRVVQQDHKISRAMGNGRVKAAKDAANGAHRMAGSNNQRFGEGTQTAVNTTLAGAALAGGSAAAGGAAKGQHTYQQHKINSRRRQNAKKKVSKMDNDPFGISKASVPGGVPSITSMKKPLPKGKIGVGLAAAGAVGGGGALVARRKQPVEKGLGDAVKAGFTALKAKPVKTPSAVKRSGQAAKKGFQAAGNASSNASSGSYVAGAAARKLRAPAALAGAGAAGYGASQHKENRIYKGETMKDESALDMTVGISKGTLEYISKAQKKSSGNASLGRQAAAATGVVAPGVHGLVAARKGKKLRTAGGQAAGVLGGGLAGAAVAGRGGAIAGNLAGGALMTNRANKKGYFKKNDEGNVSPFGIVH